MEAIEKYFLTMLFTVLFKVDVTLFESMDKTLKWIKSNFPVVLAGIIYHVVQSGYTLCLWMKFQSLMAIQTTAIERYLMSFLWGCLFFFYNLSK